MPTITNFVTDIIISFFTTKSSFVFSIVFMLMSTIYCSTSFWMHHYVVVPSQNNIDIVGLPTWLAPDMYKLNELAKEKPHAFGGTRMRYR